MAQSQRLPVRSEIDSKTAKVVKTISVADFNVSKVVGHLGHPLGTIVRITGVAVDVDQYRFAFHPLELG